MTTRYNGTVLWFRVSSGKGMIRAQSGKQFFFDAGEAEGLDLASGVLVEFDLSSDGGPQEARALQYAGGKRQIAVTSRPKKKTRQPTRKQRQAAKRAVAAPVPRRPVAMEEGTMVNHPEWGPGHVVAATRQLVSVEFLSGVRKTFKPDALADLSGPDVPKAPKRRKRAPKSQTSTKGKHRVIRRPGSKKS